MYHRSLVESEAKTHPTGLVWALLMEFYSFGTTKTVPRSVPGCVDLVFWNLAYVRSSTDAAFLASAATHTDTSNIDHSL